MVMEIKQLNEVVIQQREERTEPFPSVYFAEVNWDLMYFGRLKMN